MKLLTGMDSIKTETKAAFFDGFFGEFGKVLFGSMAKRDLECLLVKLLYDHSLIATKTNRAAANALGINESRLKGYLVDTRFKYRQDSLEENIERIIDKLHDGETLKVHDDKNDNLSFVLEDPVLRLDFAQALKEIGYYADTGFNSELVKVKKQALLALLLKRRKTDPGLYKAIAKKAGANEQELAKYLKKNTTWFERGEKIFEYIRDNPLELIGLALNIALP